MGFPLIWAGVAGLAALGAALTLTGDENNARNDK